MPVTEYFKNNQLSSKFRYRNVSFRELWIWCIPGIERSLWLVELSSRIKIESTGLKIESVTGSLAHYRSNFNSFTIKLVTYQDEKFTTDYLAMRDLPCSLRSLGALFIAFGFTSTTGLNMLDVYTKGNQSMVRHTRNRKSWLFRS